ncbi:uncharacterized protein EHS24_005544 [Apiotrichum porosum]|uniref:Serine hydrolase domain-containing protein n=1 Tax=Apiotrichum porosum TaxID=105984 RepID=A0A427XCI1_9TREE|nr:uncharacterized protein EHS24_005544 [Apiotrichum porosum]RSH76555.1 hypothetical protein EHS24_005544 [Apiotrichum porosum]
MVSFQNWRDRRSADKTAAEFKSPEPVTKTYNTSSTRTGQRSMPSRRLRILCLHGYHGSASVMRSQASSFAGEVAPYADLVFINAPSLAKGSYGWWHARSNMAGGGVVYSGWGDTKANLIDVFAKEGPFDGVLGLSQGAVLTSILCGLNGSHGIKFNFAMMVGGFLASDTELEKLYERHQRYSLPSIHVYGRRDGIVNPSATLELSRVFKNPTIVVHDGGHVIPQQRDAEAKMAAFVVEQWAKA